MALFSFIKDAGSSFKELPERGAHTAAQSEEKGETDTLEKNPAASKRLTELLKEYGLSLRELSLEVEGDKVKISGEAASQEVKEKVILAVGNVQGISEVEENISVVKEAPESRFIAVQRADSLESISERVFEEAGKEDLILKANAPLLKSAKEIYPGMVLRIPVPEQQ